MSAGRLPRSLLALAIAALLLASIPAWASDAKIVFASDRDGDGSKIYLMTTNGAVTGPIGSLPGSYADPKFSPDNRQIAFTYSAPDASDAQIYVMNADGSGTHALTSGPNSNRIPEFIQGGRIVYWHELHPGSATPPFTALYIMDLDGSHQSPLSFNNISGYIAFVSIEVNGIAAFAGKVTGDNRESEQLYTASINGSGLRRLTDSSDTFSTPGWSPDGRKLAYANRGTSTVLFSNTAPQPDSGGIYVMNADGSNAVRIVRIDFSQTFGPPTSFGAGPGRETVSMCDAPSFSPDGAMLTYAVNLGDKCQIYVVNRDGSGLKRLTDPPSTNTDPSFSH
jgi:Tol biopolymer transport system component